ncbi:hypothetical protein F4803DRAFT_553653 [Xylaria telfairii]|nr:hypothetical protein F4803DRAFT_553653 [Xylaria telfairii]
MRTRKQFPAGSEPEPTPSASNNTQEGLSRTSYPPASSLQNLWDDITGYQIADSEYSAHSVADDPLESWNEDVGYLPELYEATFEYGTLTQRVFHFLMVRNGQLQSLTSASQFPHCLYEFFNEADRQEVECGKHCCTPDAKTITTTAETVATGDGKPPPTGKDAFVGGLFGKVRVLTEISTGVGITIRMHRACPASTPPFPSHEGRPSFRTVILPDYPLRFGYNELLKLSHTNFAREKVMDTFEKIMIDYGIGQLRVIASLWLPQATRSGPYMLTTFRRAPHTFHPFFTL